MEENLARPWSALVREAQYGGRADPPCRCSHPCWLDRVFQTATSSMEAGAPEALHQIRVSARRFCFASTTKAWRFSIPPLETRLRLRLPQPFTSFIPAADRWDIWPLGIRIDLLEGTALIVVILGANTLHLSLHLRAPVAFGTVPHRETSGVEPGRERSSDQTRNTGEAQPARTPQPTNRLRLRSPPSAEETSNIMMLRLRTRFGTARTQRKERRRALRSSIPLIGRLTPVVVQ